MWLLTSYLVNQKKVGVGPRGLWATLQLPLVWLPSHPWKKSQLWSSSRWPHAGGSCQWEQRDHHNKHFRNSKMVQCYRLPWWLNGKESTCQFRRPGVGSLGGENPLEKEMATHSSIPAWEIPWREEPGGLQCMGSQRVDTTGRNGYSFINRNGIKDDTSLYTKLPRREYPQEGLSQCRKWRGLGIWW